MNTRACFRRTCVVSNPRRTGYWILENISGFSNGRTRKKKCSSLPVSEISIGNISGPVLNLCNSRPKPNFHSKPNGARKSRMQAKDFKSGGDEYRPDCNSQDCKIGRRNALLG